VDDNKDKIEKEKRDFKPFWMKKISFNNSQKDVNIKLES
jgi:hypothetical protein